MAFGIKRNNTIFQKLLDDIQNFLDENLERDGEILREESVGVCGSPPDEKDDSHNFNDYRKAEKQSKIIGSARKNKFKLKDLAVSAFAVGRHEATPIDVDAFLNQGKSTLNFQNTLQRHIADRHLENSVIYKKACIDKKFFSKIISHKDYVPKKQTVMALGLALELPLEAFENFLASGGYAFMPSSKFDLIVKYCVINKIYNLMEVDIILDAYELNCFAPK